ncbi:MAG: helix-turn-helix domain-containing protein [Rikenellaceae bacterium]|nr:helix-turn-helix domain-containing protein [Rikenellaceae bacterium]
MTEIRIRQNLKYLRKTLDLTQGEFGVLFSVSRDNIASYERGTMPKLDFIRRVVKYFGITYDDFIEGRLCTPEDADEKVDYMEIDTSSVVNEPLRKYKVVTSLAPKEKSAGWQNIPIHEFSPQVTLSSLFLDPHAAQPFDYLAASTLPRCDGEIRLTEEGTPPIFHSGDIVLYRQIHDIDNSLTYGKPYLLSFDVDGEECSTLKYLYASQRPGFVKLSAFDNNHVIKEIALSQIKALGLIRAYVRIVPVV